MSKFWQWETAQLASVKWEQGLTHVRTADCRMDPTHDTVELSSQACGAFVVTYLRKGKNTEEGGGVACPGAETPLQLMKDPSWSRYFSAASWGSHSGAGGWISLKEATDHEETPHRNRGRMCWGRRSTTIPICQPPASIFSGSLGWSWAWEDRVKEKLLV